MWKLMNLLFGFDYIQWRNPATFTPSALREACARAMVQPDMAEVERLLEAYDREYASGGSVEDYDRARAALFDYVRNIIAERDAAEMVPAGYRGAKVGTEDGGEAYSAGYFDGISAAAVRAEPNYDGYDLIDRFLRNNLDDDDYAEYMSGLQQYGDARESAGYARGLAAERERCAVMAWMHYMDTCRLKNIRAGDDYEWCCAAALRGEVKP